MSENNLNLNYSYFVLELTREQWPVPRARVATCCPQVWRRCAIIALISEELFSLFRLCRVLRIAI